jgi:hypothetical protein
MKLVAALFALFALMPLASIAQDDTKVLVPKSMLTQDQIDNATKGDLKSNVHEWAGLGKEVGEAVNQSLSAVTDQANTFAKTGVGKLTVLLVVWKVIGDQAVHLLVGLLELLVFLPLWIWSYRSTCVSRRFKIEKGKYVVKEYDRGSGDISPRSWHGILIGGLVLVFFITLFAY